MEPLGVVVALLILSVVAFAAWRARQSPATALIDDLDVVSAIRSDAAITLAALEQNLPEGWGFANHLPVGALDLVDQHGADVAKSVADAVFEGIPWLREQLDGGVVLRMVGPPEALPRLTGGELSFMVSKQGDLMGDLVGDGGAIEAKARFVREGGRALDAAAAAAAIATVLSVATRQYYLHEINSKLAAIDQKADEILGKLDDQRVAKYRAATATVSEVHTAAVDQLSRRGVLDMRFPTEFWTRMSTAEQALREVIAECEADYDRQQQKWLGKLGELSEDGRWVRRRTQKRDDIDTFEEIANWFTSTGTLHLQAVHSMAKWYQVALLHDTGVEIGEDLQVRYDALSGFLNERRRFWAQQDVDEHVYLGFEGDHRWDQVRDVAAWASLTTLVGGIALHKARKTDEKHADLRRALNESFSAWNEILVPFRPATDTFYVTHDATRGVRMLKVPDGG